MKIKSIKNAFLSTLLSCILVLPQVQAQSTENSFALIKRQASTTLNLTPDQKAEYMLTSLNVMSSDERKDFFSNAEINATKLARRIQNEEGKLFKAKSKHIAYVATAYVALISGITSASSGVMLLVSASVNITDGFKFSSAESAEMIKYNKRLGAAFLISGTIAAASFYYIKKETTGVSFELNELEIVNLSNQLAGLKQIVLEEQKVIETMKAYYNLANY